MTRPRLRLGHRATFAFSVLVGLMARLALGATPPVVILEGAEADAVVKQLVPELRLAGFAVKLSPAPPFEDAASEADVLLQVTESAVEIWLIDRVTRRPRRIEALPIPRPRTSTAAVTAVRVTEIVRARWLPATAELPDEPRSSPASPPVPTAPSASSTPSMFSEPSAEPLAPVPVSRPPLAAPPGAVSSRPVGIAVPSRGRFGIDLGPALVVSPGGVPPAADLFVTPSFAPRGDLVLRAIVTVPIISPEVSSTQGRASVQAWIAGVACDWHAAFDDGLWTTNMGAGVAASWLRSQGAAAPSDVSSSAAAISALPFVEASGARALWTTHVRLGVHGMLGVALPAVQIRFADQNVALWGRPLAAASVAMEVDGP